VPDEIREQVYNPSVDGPVEDVKIDIKRPSTMGDENPDVEVTA
jgi:hypothetical protein